MTIFRDEESSSKIETLKSACPICHGDVKGNEEYHYFCKHCNILFRRIDLVLRKEVVDAIVREKIAQKSSKTPLRVEEVLKTYPISEGQQAMLREHKERPRYIISLKSEMIHAQNCPYAKNIKRENRQVTFTLDNHYKKCRCII